MRIPTDTALWLQEQMLGLDHEDWGLVYMLSGNLASIAPGTAARLQLGVDLIYRGLACNLIDVNDYGAFPDRPSFFEGIRTLDPDDVAAVDDMSGAGFWHATLVWGTQRLSKLIEAYFPPPDQRDDKLNLLSLRRSKRSSPRAACRGRTSHCFQSYRLAPTPRASRRDKRIDHL